MTLRDPKGKGRRFERGLVAYLREVLPEEWEIRRVPLSGSAPGYGGDVEIRTPFGMVLKVECKNRQDLQPLIDRLQRLQGAADLLALHVRAGQFWIVMPRKTFDVLFKHLAERR